MQSCKAVGAALCAAIVLAGCAIRQTVKPVEQLATREICLIDNPAVRASFVDAYKRSLATKGYAVRQLPATARVADCATTSTYTAHWRWDLALYMSYAEINVFSNGRSVGQARYDAQRGNANMNKFIDADRKINELVNQLFPGGAGT